MVFSVDHLHNARQRPSDINIGSAIMLPCQGYHVDGYHAVGTRTRRLGLTGRPEQGSM